MSEELNLVRDLAVILISAGIFTIISKALKQPLILGYIIAGFLITYRWKARRYETVSTRYQGGNDLHMSNGAFQLMTHVWHPDQFAEKKTASFEGLPCLIPVRYDEVLTVLYGPDYMTPPPADQQVAKHLDL